MIKKAADGELGGSVRSRNHELLLPKGRRRKERSSFSSNAMSPRKGGKQKTGQSRRTFALPSSSTEKGGGEKGYCGRQSGRPKREVRKKVKEKEEKRVPNFLISQKRRGKKGGGKGSQICYRKRGRTQQVPEKEAHHVKNDTGEGQKHKTA